MATGDGDEGGGGRVILVIVIMLCAGLGVSVAGRWIAK